MNKKRSRITESYQTIVEASPPIPIEHVGMLAALLGVSGGVLGAALTGDWSGAALLASATSTAPLILEQAVGAWEGHRRRQMQRRALEAEIAAAGHQRALYETRERAALVAAQERLHQATMDRHIRMAELHLATKHVDRSATTALTNGQHTVIDPQSVVARATARQWWRDYVLKHLFSLGSIEKTRHGNWIGGQPLTVAILGRTRLEGLMRAGFVYRKGNHYQWDVALGGDSEEEALRRIENVGLLLVGEPYF